MYAYIVTLKKKRKETMLTNGAYPHVTSYPCGNSYLSKALIGGFVHAFLLPQLKS